MPIEFVEGPWKASGREALHYRVETPNGRYLCRITDLAIFDDYGLSYEEYSLESAFEAYSVDILRRTELLLPSNPQAEDGEPVVIIKRGNGVP